MRKGMILAGGAAAILIATGVGAVIATGDKSEALAQNGGGESQEVAAAQAPRDCQAYASNQTGFDPATTPVPVREDAGNKQVLKGTAAGAAFGAVAGELIGDKAGYGAAAGAAAGAAGGQAMKVNKQQNADAEYEQAAAAYQQQKTAYDSALATCLASG